MLVSREPAVESAYEVTEFESDYSRKLEVEASDATVESLESIVDRRSKQVFGLPREIIKGVF